MKKKETQYSIRYLDTIAAYDLWSEVYDTDGNFLQALDSIEMKSLLPKSLSEIRSDKPWKIVDLGCGTGRNTSALLHIQNSTVIGLDASPKMLEIARSRLQGSAQQPEMPNTLHLEVYDMIKDPPPLSSINADAIVSTLVVEHVQLDTFFHAASRMLKEEGLLLVTNMHSEMGSISQAGFIDPKSGEKIRPRSYVHRIEEILVESRRQGFELVGDVSERSVDEHISRHLGLRARKWIGVTVWFGMIFRKRILL